MTIDTSREAVERILDGVTPGPWQSDGVFMDRDHEVRVAMPDNYGVPMATIAEAFHNWNDVTDVAERRISWKEAEANARFIAASRELVPALLARAEAAEAEVARLSTPPDDAEVEMLVGHLVSWELSGETADQAASFLTRQAHALASETAKREAMEEALEPFAKAGELFAGTKKDPTWTAVLYNPAAGTDYQITECHVRDAFVVLAKHRSKT